MSDEFKEVIMSHIKRDVLFNALKSGKRFDGRAYDQFRGVEIQKDVIKTAEGSAFVKMGGTQVLVGVKFDVATPFPDRQDEGVLMTGAELSPIASSTFEAGPPDENSIELARVVDRGIRSSETIDLKSFFIEEGKVLALYIDVYVLDYAGNYTDAASLAAIAALTCTKMPKLEGGKIIRGEYTGKLKLTSHPLTVTSIKAGDYWLVDPVREEEMAMDTRLTIATTEEHVCAIQKGKGYITKQELMDTIDMSFRKGNELRRLLQ